MSAVALRNFAIVSAGGSAVFLEGQVVPDAIAKRYPEHIVGTAKVEKPLVHNPRLKEKPTKREIAKMSEEDMRQWFAQFHPGECPSGDASKAELTEAIAALVD